MQTSARYGVSYPSLDRSDAPDIPQHLANIVAGLEQSAMYGQGTLAARPTSSGGTPGKQGRFYAATDQTPNKLYYDYGTGWFEVGALATGSVGTTQLADGAVTTIKIGDGQVSSQKLVDASVTTAKIVDAAVTDTKLAAALKPSQGAGGATEALRALGTAAGTAAAGSHHTQHEPGGPDAIALTTIHRYGTLAARPAATGLAGVLYFTTDGAGAYESDGASWILTAPDLSSVYRTVAHFGGMASAFLSGGALFYLGNSNLVNITSLANVPYSAGVYLDPADYAVPGKTLKLRFRFWVAVNDVAPGINFWADLATLNTPGGGAGIVKPGGAGSVGASSPTINTPAANSFTVVDRGDGSFTTPGLFIARALASSQSIAANSAVQVGVEVQVRNV